MYQKSLLFLAILTQSLLLGLQFLIGLNVFRSAKRINKIIFYYTEEV